jgi:hypothetical protein
MPSGEEASAVVWPRTEQTEGAHTPTQDRDVEVVVHVAQPQDEDVLRLLVEGRRQQPRLAVPTPRHH